MKRVLSMCAALALGVTMATTASAQRSVQQADYRAKQAHSAKKTQPGQSITSALDQLRGNVKLAGFEGGDFYSGEVYSGDTYGGDPCGGACDVGCSEPCGVASNGRCWGQFFMGGEALWVRANPSEAISYLSRDLTNISSPSDTFNQFDFDYDSSFRVYGGCRNACGEEIRFTFTRFDTGADFVSPTVPTGSSGAIQFIAPLEVVAVTDGSYLEGDADVSLNSYDLGWSKTIPLGSPLCGPCDCGDVCGGDVCGSECGDCCGTWCPAWDVTFTGALRAADMNAERNFVSFNASDVAQTTGRSQFDFEGVGARFGMLGRRYFGPRGMCSVYLKGDLSLLVGEYETMQERASAATPNQVTSQSISCTHVIPVTEIEVGGSMFITCNTSLSTGYFVSAWHDLGFRDEYDFGLQTSYDDANIMGFDGYFIRLETSF